MMRERDIIARYFTRKNGQSVNRLGVGDDAAIIRVPAKKELVVSIDTLIEGVHFFKSSDPFNLGHKTLAVSLSDIAAMGATPISALLSISRPSADKKWLNAFQKGFFNLATQFKVDLIGGDTCQGPLSLSSVVHGFIPHNQAILRSGAKIGDFIFVSGTLGDAGFAVQSLQKKQKITPYFRDRLERPSPRVTLGEFLRPFANAMIDISDGLMIDLGRLLEASNMGANIYTQDLPISKELQKAMSPKNAVKMALTGGDDYELCFTVSEKMLPRLKKSPTPITCIGRIEKKLGLRILDDKNNILTIPKKGYEHF